MLNDLLRHPTAGNIPGTKELVVMPSLLTIPPTSSLSFTNLETLRPASRSSSVQLLQFLHSTTRPEYPAMTSLLSQKYLTTLLL